MNATFPYPDLACRLLRLVKAGKQEAARHSHPMLVSATVAVPPVESVELFRRSQSQHRILWEQPSQQLVMVALGTATQLVTQGIGMKLTT